MTTQQNAFSSAYALLIIGKQCKLFKIDGVWYCQEVVK